MCMCITLYLFVCFADLGLSAAVIIGIVLAVIVPLCCIGVCIAIIVIAVCTGACAAGAVSSRGRRRNVNAAVVTGTGSAPPPYTSAAYPATQPQGGPGAPAAYPQQQPPATYPPQQPAAYPDEQKVELQEYQADPAYPLQPPPTN